MKMIDYTSDAKSNDNDLTDIEVRRSTRVSFKVESLFYAILGFIIGLPFIIFAIFVWCCKKSYRAMQFIWDKLLYPILEQVGIKLIQLCRLIGNGIGYVFKQIIRVPKYGLYLFGRINWYIVRSISRMVTIIGSIVSLLLITDGFLKYPSNVIITGKYMDVNPQIVILHTLMIYVLMNIVIYYFLWVLSPDNETVTIRKYTKGWSEWSSRLMQK